MRSDRVGKAAVKKRCRSLLWIGLVCASAGFVGPSFAQQNSDRVALLIANAKYPDARVPLSTPAKDATQLADQLRRLNFSVEFKTDLGKEDMQRALDTFVGNIKENTTALFYFSGFGLQVSRRSYVLPTNVQIWTEADVRRDGISVDSLLADIIAKARELRS